MELSIPVQPISIVPIWSENRAPIVLLVEASEIPESLFFN